MTIVLTDHERIENVIFPQGVKTRKTVDLATEDPPKLTASLDMMVTADVVKGEEEVVVAHEVAKEGPAMALTDLENVDTTVTLAVIRRKCIP